jgi:hypothetical protein
VGPRTGLDDVERRKIFLLSGLEFRPLGRLLRSQSLHRLNYPDSLNNDVTQFHYEKERRVNQINVKIFSRINVSVTNN